MAATVTCPLDVVRTRLQSSSGATFKSLAAGPRVNTSGWFRPPMTIRVLMWIGRTEGIKGLWKGLPPTLVGVVPARSVYFLTYATAKATYGAALGSDHHAGVHMASAATAGAVTTTLTNPIWLVKTRMQIQDAALVTAAKTGGGAPNFYYSSSLDAFKQIYAKEGLKGFMKGLSASYLGISEGVLNIMLFEQGKLFAVYVKTGLQAAQVRTASDHLSPLEMFIIGAFARLIATTTTYPHEVLRTRLREQTSSGSTAKYRGLAHAARTIVAEEGLRGMYRGMVPHVVRVVPSSAIMFTTYESVVKLLNDSAVE